MYLKTEKTFSFSPSHSLSHSFSLHICMYIIYLYFKYINYVLIYYIYFKYYIFIYFNIFTKNILIYNIHVKILSLHNSTFNHIIDIGIQKLDLN